MTASARILPPGTDIFGILYSDASCGHWQPTRDAAATIIPDLRRVGLNPVGLICLRMKSEMLVCLG